MKSVALFVFVIAVIFSGIVAMADEETPRAAFRTRIYVVCSDTFDPATGKLSLDLALDVVAPGDDETPGNFRRLELPLESLKLMTAETSKHWDQAILRFRGKACVGGEIMPSHGEGGLSYWVVRFRRYQEQHEAYIKEKKLPEKLAPSYEGPATSLGAAPEDWRWRFSVVEGGVEKLRLVPRDRVTVILRASGVSGAFVRLYGAPNRDGLVAAATIVLPFGARDDVAWLRNALINWKPK